MNELLHHLIEALREELKQYGEMLALLEHQQELVILRHGPALLQSMSAVDAQAEVLWVARGEREQRRLDLARILRLDEAISLRELISRLPTEFRPLIEALIEENNELLQRIVQRTRQNHLVLRRALELMQLFINTLVPITSEVAYAETGRPKDAGKPQRSVYHAPG